MLEAATQSPTLRDLRADARRNRERILLAARDVFVERGPDAPLEEIAARAGVGIATLYRRFPDRAALLRAVVLDVLQRVEQEVRLAQVEEPDAWHALLRYMRAVLDLRVSAVVPVLLGRVALEDAEIMALRNQVTTPIQQLIARAQTDGDLRPDVAFADISLLLVRLARPLPGPISPQLNDQLARRHFGLLVDGLRNARAQGTLPGPALTLEDVRGLPAAERDATTQQFG